MKMTPSQVIAHNHKLHPKHKFVCENCFRTFEKQPWCPDCERIAIPISRFVGGEQGKRDDAPAAGPKSPRPPVNSVALQFFANQGLPEPARELVFSPTRQYRFDYAWLEHKVALEVEGGIFTKRAHGSIKGQLRDIEKYNLAACLGWRVLRCVPDKLLTVETCTMLKAAMKVSKP